MYIYNNVKTGWVVRIVALLFTIHCSLFTIPLCAAAASAKSDSIVYSMERPLIYEDAWDLWPYTFLNENGEPDGYNIDMLKLIFKRLDIPFIIKLKPTKDALEDLKNGKSDLMLGMDANFHDEYGNYGASVVGLFTHSVVHEKGVAPKVKSFRDLEHNQVMVHTGSFSHHLMIDNGWGDNAIGYDDMKESIRKASLEPGTEIVWNTMSLKWLIQKYQITNLELSPVDIPHGEYKFMSLNHRLLAQIDSVYSVLRSEERLLPIQNKWFYPERKETGIPSWVWKLAILLAALAALALCYYLFYHFREKKLTKDLRQKNARLSLILSTSNVRFWTYDIPTKTFTLMDEHGNPTSSFTILEFSQRYNHDDFVELTEAINKLARQEEEQMTIELHGSEERSSEKQRLGKHSSGMNPVEIKDREYTIELGVLRRHRNGRPSVIIGTRSDITEERRLKRQAQNTMLLYQAIFNSAMVDMVYFDKDGYLYDLNEKAARTFNSTREEIIRAHNNLRDVLDISEEDLRNFEYSYVTQIFSHPDEDHRINHHIKRHDKMYYELQLVPVYDKEHNLLGIYGTGRDVTEVVNTYNRQQENLRKLEKANDEVTSYIQNINYVMKVGGVRMMRYSSNTHMLTIFDEIGHAQYELTQTRTLGLTCDSHRHIAQRMLNSMDNHTQILISTTIQTTLHTRSGHPLCLQIHFVPDTSVPGSPTEYLGMCRDVSQIKYTEEELKKETVRAQEVEVVKNAFLRNMSYEIRTPLNTVVGFAELFQMDHSSDDERVFIEEIKENSRTLLTLINNILFLSRLDAKMIEIKPKTTDMAKVFDNRCQTCWAQLQVPGVEYRIENPYEELMIDIDANNVGIILDQIITNACQHTTKGLVRTRIDYIGDRLILAVEDTGEGIAKEFLPTIFERFATGANIGSGLGLSICYELVQQMDGTINIKSEPGKGTTVWVSIPCKASEIVRK